MGPLDSQNLEIVCERSGPAGYHQRSSARPGLHRGGATAPQLDQETPISLLPFALFALAAPAVAAPSTALPVTASFAYVTTSTAAPARESFVYVSPLATPEPGVSLLLAQSHSGTSPFAVDREVVTTHADAEASSPFRVSNGWFAVISTAGIATAYQLDTRVWAVASDSGASGSHAVADAVAKLGDLRYIGPALLAGYVYGRVAKLPGASSAAVRIAGSTAVAGAATLVMKFATGRSRPDAAPGDHDQFNPFSGADAFPSGHTTVAFACAAALDQETRSAWVPWIAYPTAALVGWARIVQDRHWLSDVVAGAAVGTWVGREVDVRLQQRARSGPAVSPLVQWSPRRTRVGVAMKF
jgi:membrane-associated phospholipid phosphatase